VSKLGKQVCRKLKNDPSAAVLWPSHLQMVEFAAIVALREPLVKNVFGFVDGLSIPAQCNDDDEEQAISYNGYHGDTTINNVFAFSPFGKIIFACFNFPGSWHDSQVCSGLIDKVIRTCGEFALCVDQGFPRSGLLQDKFVGPITKKRRRHLNPLLKDLLLERHALYVSLRQASEWGMRALQGTFSRLKSRLTSDKKTRKVTVHSIILLHNFRVHHMGINQIATVFNPHYEQYINLDGYDRIARYFNE
jgi:hypothetical protein